MKDSSASINKGYNTSINKGYNVRTHTPNK